MGKPSAGAVFKALADPTRLAVVEQLAAGPASMTELARSHPMALPSFAQHLGILEQAGLLQSNKQGRVRSYQLVPATLLLAEDWIGQQRALWEQRLQRLDRYVQTMAKETQQTSPPRRRRRAKPRS